MDHNISSPSSTPYVHNLDKAAVLIVMYHAETMERKMVLIEIGCSRVMYDLVMWLIII